MRGAEFEVSPLVGTVLELENPLGLEQQQQLRGTTTACDSGVIDVAVEDVVTTQRKALR